MNPIIGVHVQIITIIILLLTMFSSREIVTTQSVFSHLPLKKIEFVKLVEVAGGASNHNYLLKTKSQKIFLRTAENPEALAQEAATAFLVSDAGFAPEIVSYSKENKILASKMIDHLKEFDLYDADSRKEVARLVRSLHDSSISFSTTRSPTEVVAALVQEAKRLEVAIPKSLVKDVCKVLKRTTFDAENAVPCHLDLHKGNFLLDDKRFWIIDWEYAANSDPLFELAILSSTENFSDVEMFELLTAYGKPEDFGQMYAYRMVADARWAIWCLVKGKNATLDFPYEEEYKRYYKSFYCRYRGKKITS